VLFADLVGFTTLSESRDAEDVRELLSEYFETCRTLITRYGGTVEKFIGDAVMAVWGAPLAQEDDAERAVRAAIDLVAAIPLLGADAGAPDLQARAGVLTGEAAVNLGATHEGLVAGDLVNTASRIQAAAPPGQVLVGDATRRATEASIAYGDAGTHELKGKSESVRLWRAIRVVAAVGGAQKSTGLEAPFVGRDREFRSIKDLLHQTIDEGKAHLVSIVGIAGIGKSRLGWELNKYIDGLSQLIRWHRGRCLSYGEGVTYWALAEMVRTRAGIVEGESAAVARDKLRGAVEASITDPEERRWAEPRLAQLLGLEERAGSDREDMFAAWRLFYERLADEMPTIMIFEDIQWADESLLDFIEYLMEWSRNHAIFVVTLGRSELLERRPTWGAGKRNVTSMFLEPLSEPAMREMLSGLVPGLPEPVQDAILTRAEGVPLYAMETVRMLLDQGHLAEENGVYRPTGPTTSLAVPETLQALISARLDALAPDERGLVQDLSVLGKTFTRQAASAVSSLPADAIDAHLASLVRREFLSIQSDPFSPERGQYGFLQDLVRKVAYDTLSKRDRKARHLAVATYLERSWGAEEEEIVEVVASHYVQAYEAAPDADDADAIKAGARDMLARAGDRAASLSANAEAERYFEQAAGLTEDHTARALLLERAGISAWNAVDAERAATHFEQAIGILEAEGAAHPAARVSARLGEVEWRLGKLDQAIERMERSFAVLREDEPDEDLAALAAELGRLQYFAGHGDLTPERIEVAEEIAQALWLPEVLCQALITKALVAAGRGWWVESIALLRHALELALEHDLIRPALRAHMNLADVYCRRDRYEDATLLYEQGIALARRAGHGLMEQNLRSELTFPLTAQGRWDEVLELASGDQVDLEGALLSLLTAVPEILAARGDSGGVAGFEAAGDRLRGSADVQDHATGANILAIVAEAGGDRRAVLALATEALEFGREVGPDGSDVKQAVVRAWESALARGEVDEARSLLAQLDALRPGELAPYLDAQRSRLRGRLAAAEGADGVEAGFKQAAGAFRELGTPFWLAVTLLEHGEWLVGAGRPTDAEPLLTEARSIFERLEAAPWIERVDATGQVRESANA
jgi:predicted ATPase/class 3 adenylate cyclase